MKKFFLKNNPPDNITRLDPVTALEERLKSVDTISDPAERLLALKDFYKDCRALYSSKDNVSFLKKLGGSICAGVTVGGISFPFLGPLAVFPGTSVTVVSFLGSFLYTNSTLKKLAHLEKNAMTLRDNLIKTGDLKMLVASPLFDAAALEFSPLKERFQLAAQKAAFLGQDKNDVLPLPQKPNDGFRL